MTRELQLGARIRALRQARRLTLRDVSERAGVTESFLSQVERDVTSPSIATLQRVAHARAGRRHPPGDEREQPHRPERRRHDREREAEQHAGERARGMAGRLRRRAGVRAAGHPVH